MRRFSRHALALAAAALTVAGLAAALTISAPTIVAQEAAGAPEASREAGSDPREEPAGVPLVHVLRWDDAITPVTRSAFADALADAEEAGASALVIELDTPGGLVDATRDIVSDFFDAEVPVIMWVGPTGARAASAGSFLTMAAHVATMAPGTNIGASSPVTMGGGGAPAPGGAPGGAPNDTSAAPSNNEAMSNKMFNDTAAFARTIAERRGRNVEWAEASVREAVSVTETEAVEENVVDYVAATIEAAVAGADGRTVEVDGVEVTLELADATLERRELPFRYKVLSLLANPNVAYILMMFGVYGLFFELQSPGTIFPGVVGAICLILGLYSMQTVPLNLAGILLLGLGGILLLLETQVPSFGLLTLGGLVASALGAIMVFDSPEPALRASLWVVLPVTLVSGLLFAVAAGLAARTFRLKPATGGEAMIGVTGSVREALNPEGTVDLHGEIWSAVADEPLAAGDAIVVEERQGLRLKVKRK